jgi:hypothetical protein
MTDEHWNLLRYPLFANEGIACHLIALSQYLQFALSTPDTNEGLGLSSAFQPILGATFGTVPN